MLVAHQSAPLPRDFGLFTRAFADNIPESVQSRIRAHEFFQVSYRVRNENNTSRVYCDFLSERNTSVSQYFSELRANIRCNFFADSDTTIIHKYYLRFKFELIIKKSFFFFYHFLAGQVTFKIGISVLLVPPQWLVFYS